MTIEIGRLVTKIAGRDAGKKAVIIDVLDDKFVLIDGETRRRKCNILHLEPLKDVIKIDKNASHEEVKEEFKKLGLKARETKPKAKTERPKKRRKTPEQLRAQKEEKKKLRGMFKLGRKEKGEKAEEEKGESLEDKAGLMKEKREEVKGGLKITPVENEKEAKEGKTTKSREKREKKQ